MATQQHIRNQIIRIQICEQCKMSHEFSIELILSEEVNAIGLSTTNTENHDIVLVCPATNKNIVVSVSVSMHPLETLVQIKPKR